MMHLYAWGKRMRRGDRNESKIKRGKENKMGKREKARERPQCERVSRVIALSHYIRRVNQLNLVKINLNPAYNFRLC
jgi:hypothetical protein